VRFGVVFTLNVAIGACTPDRGEPDGRLPHRRHTLESTVYRTPWMAATMTAVLLLLTFVPGISLFLPRALGNP
jgi:TRAP-type C4-dicarboxylate transport system permease large subunit